MNRNYYLDAVVIKKIKIGEADSIITVFSRQKGKKVLKALGIRKVTSRKSPHLEIFNRTRLFVYRGKSLDLVTEATSINNFSGIRKDVDRIAHAYKVMELIDRLLPQEEANWKVFKSLCQIISRIELIEKKRLSLEVDGFFQQLLSELGFLKKGDVLKPEVLNSYLEDIIERKVGSQKFINKLKRLL